jgi:hypothetical protein
VEEREVDQYDAAKWAVSVIYGMFDNARANGIPHRHREGCSRYEQPEATEDG